MTLTEAQAPEQLALQRALAGRYSVTHELGRGGMGIVYLARDVALDRPVAIKLLPPSMAADPELRERFLREARTAAQLSHPHIVPIHLVEERDGLVYFVMAFVDGESLGARLLRAGPLGTAEAVRIVQEVAWALAYAHSRGIVHRDVKPDNILLDRAAGRALVTDFGIARSTAAPALTSQGLILGTVQFMAPEQADPGASLDGRADLYALGVTAFYAMSGRLPFESGVVTALLAAHLLEPPPPLRSLAPNVPARVAEAIDRCLAKAPDARWPTGEALAEALVETGTAARAMPPSIRGFVNGLGGAGMQLMLLALVGAWADILMPEQMRTVLMLLGFVAITPVIQMVVTARGVAIAGFNATDIAEAMAAEMQASDRYTEHQKRELQRSVRQLDLWWVRLIVAGFGILEIVVGAGALLKLAGRGVGIAPLVFGLISLPFGVLLLGVAARIGRLHQFAVRTIEGSEGRRRRILVWFWKSAPVRWLLKLGSIGTRRAAAPTPDAQAGMPTEALLANAAGDVFAGLAAEDRRSLSALPDVVKRLEVVATRMRDRRAQIERAIADAGAVGTSAKRDEVVAELADEKGRIEARLRLAVECLENLRLDLLKLRAGVGTTDDLTEAMEAARRIGEDVDRAILAKTT